LILVVYSASMVSTGAWDPWETHYGEVARQILVRSDPMDLWWKPGNSGPAGSSETTFFSKPALPFWLMALSMKIFGVGTSVDPAEMVRPLWPELAIRMPSLLVGLASAGFLGYVVARQVTVRAGILVAFALSTMPQWAMATRQAITDMIFVGPVVLAMGTWAIAWLEEDRELRDRGRGWRRIPWDRAYLAFLIALVVAALVPLAVLHQHVIDPDTIAQVGRMRGKYVPRLRSVFLHLWIYWAIAAAVLVMSLRWRRRSQACMGIAYLAAGVSTMGKGLIGPGVILVACLAHVAVSGRWNIVRRASLPAGILLFVLACFPWHHAMILFRGGLFVNEWILANNLERFATGEQTQAMGSFAYYLRTLGLAAFPWAALAPLSLWHGARSFGKPEAEGTPYRARTELGRLALLWLVLSLWLVTYSITKYYHYLLPCLPPLAVLVGLWMDRVLGKGRIRLSWTVAGAGCVLGLAYLAMVCRDAYHEPAWIAHLTTYLYTGMWTRGAPEVGRLLWVGVPFAVGLVLVVLGRYRAAVAAMVLSGALTAVYVIDDYMPAASENWSQRSMMRVYFDRRGPNDRLLSWWFKYRGETYFSKADIWVATDPERKELAEFIEENEGQGVTLWFATTAAHGRRLKSHLPYKYRNDTEVAYESFHYMLVRLPLE